MDTKEFEELVSDAIDNIPSDYQEKIKNVTFRVEDEPSTKQRTDLNLRSCDALFGLYTGVPLTKRGGAVHAMTPDVITIFMHPMVEIFPEFKDLRTQIFKTVWHEVAHYFGLDHEMINNLEKK